MSREVLAAAVAAAFFLTAGVASAELAEWNQERVAKYAAELKLATTDLRRSLEGIGIQNIAQQNAMYQVRDTVEMLDTAANGLDHALQGGKGRDETLPRFKRIETLRRDAEQQGRRADIPEAVFERVFHVGSALQKLRPYYVEAPMEEEGEATAQ